jgi:hypothetical protein
MPSIINSDNGVVSGTSGLKTTGGNDGITTFQQNGTESARINASGNVGIGTTTPPAGSRLAVVGGGTQISGGTTSQEGIRVQRISGAATITGINNDNNAYNDIALYAGASEGARLTTGNNFQFNSGYGSVATAYGCRAWVNFNGTTNVGGFCTVRASGNVSSVADNGTGDYTVNFTTAMPDADYAATGASSFIGTTNYVGPVAFNNNNSTGASVAPTTTALRTVIRNSGATAADPQYLYVAIFR